MFRKKTYSEERRDMHRLRPLCPVSASDSYVYFRYLTNKYAESNGQFYFTFDTKTNFKLAITNLTYFVFLRNLKYYEIDNIKFENKPDSIVWNTASCISRYHLQKMFFQLFYCNPTWNEISSFRLFSCTLKLFLLVNSVATSGVVGKTSSIRLGPGFDID